MYFPSHLLDLALCLRLLNSDLDRDTLLRKDGTVITILRFLVLGPNLVRERGSISLRRREHGRISTRRGSIDQPLLLLLPEIDLILLLIIRGTRRNIRRANILEDRCLRTVDVSVLAPRLIVNTDIIRKKRGDITLPLLLLHLSLLHLYLQIEIATSLVRQKTQ